VRQTILARRYAKALFSLGKEKNKLESYNEALAAIAALYDEIPEVGDSLTTPLYPLDARQKVMKKIAQSVNADAILTAFLNLLVEKQRAGALPDIAQEMQVMVDKDKNISHGIVVSAIKLDSDLQGKIQATLEKITGNKVMLETKVDPSIIGGIIAKVSDLVFDGSIKTQLNGLKESIKGRE